MQKQDVPPSSNEKVPPPNQHDVPPPIFLEDSPSQANSSVQVTEEVKQYDPKNASCEDAADCPNPSKALANDGKGSNNH